MATLEKQNDRVNIEIDSKLEKDSQELFDSLGLNLTTAVNIFLKKSLEIGGIPFDVKHSTPNAETVLAIEEARADIQNRTKPQGYSSAKDLLDDLDKDEY